MSDTWTKGAVPEADAQWSPDSEDAGPDAMKLEYHPRRADPERLRTFAADALVAVGVPPEDAALCAEVLVEADLCGSETHGMPLLYTHYVMPVRAGAVNPRPHIRVAEGSPTTVAVDGDNGLGMVVGVRAMEECLRMAAAHGSGWAVCYRTNHSAAGGHYVRMAAARRMIGFHWSTGGATIAPPGGGGRLLGNNPFSFGAPAGEDGPFVLDMAPSTTIRPKIRMQGWSGESLPEHWVVDDDGAPVTDPRDYFERRGAILPLGGTPANGAYKGFGLLLVSDVMTGALSGDGGSMVRAKGAHTSAFGALSVDAFPTAGEYDSAMASMIEALHAASTADGSPVRYPGERAHAEYLKRQAEGIPLRRYLVDELEAMAADLDLSLDSIWLQ